MKKTRRELEAELEKAAGTAAEAPAPETALVPEEAGQPSQPDGVERLEAEPQTELVPVIESLLFAAPAALSLAELLGVLREFHPRLDTRKLRRTVESLGEQLEREGRGVRLVEVGGGYQLRTPPEAARYLRKLDVSRPPRISRATLETLAIVAYRQPVTRGEVEDVRGVDCGAVLRGLLEKKLVRILGRKDEPGRPLIYGTTKEFLAFFSLKDLASLPTLRDFAELSDEARQQLGLGQVQVAAAEAQEAQLPEPLDDERQAAYSPPGDDEMVQELSQTLEEIRRRDARLREALPPAPPPPAAAPEPAPGKEGGPGPQEPGA